MGRARRMVLGGLMLAATAGAAEPLRFEDLPRLVAQNNRHAQGARLFMEAAEERQGHLSRSFLPTVRGEAGTERFTTGDLPARTQPYGGVEARLNLFNGGKDALEEKINGGRTRRAAAEYRQSYVEELTEARRAYWTLAAGQETVRVLEEALKRNDDYAAAAAKRLRAGLVTETDRLEFDMYGVQLRQDLARLSLEAANARRTLTALVGLPEGGGVEVSSQVTHGHDETFPPLDAARHRDVQALGAARAEALHQRDQARRWWTPAVEAYAGYWLLTERDRDYAERRDRDDRAAGVRVSVDLFDGRRSRAGSAALAKEAEGLELRTAQTARELAARHAALQEEMRVLHDLVHDAEAGADQGKRYVSNTLAEYARGVKNSPDVLAAAEKHVELERRSVELRRDYQLAKAELLAILGE